MIQEFFTTELGATVYAVLIVAAADFAFGIMAALRDGTFSLDAIAAVLRKHILGRVGPIFGLLFFGHIGGQDPLIGAGMVAAGLYVAETVGSILTSWGPNRATQPVPEE